MAGLAAAASLSEGKGRVQVLDKGRGVGGRMASRRIGGAVFDHGAQFITARDPRFQARLDDWSAANVVERWCLGFGQDQDGHPRYRGRPAMTAIAKHLARDLDVRLQTQVTAIERRPSGWRLACAGDESITAEALIVTAPVPQSLALLSAIETDVPSALIDRLRSIQYDPCLAVMARLKHRTEIPEPGAMAFNEGPIAWIADNQAKGVSPEPAVTVHATAEFSARHWETDRREVGARLLRAASHWIGSPVIEFQVHGWRYSKPSSIDPRRCVELSNDPPLVIAGDAFAGPRVEGAFLSGLEAARRLQGDVRAEC